MSFTKMYPETVTLAVAGETVDVTGSTARLSLVGLEILDTFTGSSLTFSRASLEEKNTDGTPIFLPCQDTAGLPISLTGVVGPSYIAIPPGIFPAGYYFRLTSDVAQATAPCRIVCVFAQVLS